MRAGELTEAAPNWPRLHAAVMTALACGFGWAARLSFVTKPRHVSGLSAVIGVAVAFEVVHLTRVVPLAERLAWLAACAAIVLGSAWYFPAMVNAPVSTLEGTLGALAALLFALAAARRLKNARPLDNGPEVQL